MDNNLNNVMDNNLNPLAAGGLLIKKKNPSSNQYVFKPPAPSLLGLDKLANEKREKRKLGAFSLGIKEEQIKAIMMTGLVHPTTQAVGQVPPKHQIRQAIGRREKLLVLGLEAPKEALHQIEGAATVGGKLQRRGIPEQLFWSQALKMMCKWIGIGIIFKTKQ